jgi:hypothetical protein
MYGSSAQKTAVQQQAVGTGNTLAEAQRLSGPRAATGAEQATSSKAARLAQLGGLGNRVEQQVRAQFQKPLAGATLEVDANKLATFKPEEQELIKQIATAATPQEREAAMVALANVRGTNLTNIQTLVKDMGVSLGEQGAQAVGLTQVSLDPALLEEFGGVNQVAADIGVTPEELGAMTVEQFEAKINELESKEFSQVQALQAELKSATPIRQQEIKQELQALGAIGATGVELGVQNLQQQIEDADKVMFNGTEYELGNLLENQAISDAITLAIRDPKSLESLKASEPELAAWIEQNQADLQNIVGDIESSQQAFNETVTKTQELVAGVNPETLAAFGIENQFMTAEELANKTSEVAGSGAWQIIKEPGAAGVAIQEDPSIIGKLITKNAATGEDVPMTAEQVQDSFDLATLFKEESPNAALYKELIPGITGNFITDAAVASTIKGYKDIIESFDKTVLAADSKLLIELMKAGKISAKDAKNMDLEDIKNLRARADGIKKVEDFKGNVDALLSFALGGKITAQDINNKLAMAKRYASIDPEAKKIYDSLSKLDTNRDGKIDTGDKLANTLKGLLGGDKPVSAMLDIDPSNIFSNIQRGFNTAAKASHISTTDTKAIAQTLVDGTVSVDELFTLTPEQVNKALKAGFVSNGTFTKFKKEEKRREDAATLTKYRTDASDAVTAEIASSGLPGAFTAAGNLNIDEKALSVNPEESLAKLQDLRKRMVGLSAKAGSTTGYGEYLYKQAGQLDSLINKYSNLETEKKQATQSLSELELQADKLRRELYDPDYVGPAISWKQHEVLLGKISELRRNLKSKGWVK